MLSVPVVVALHFLIRALAAVLTVAIHGGEVGEGLAGVGGEREIEDPCEGEVVTDVARGSGEAERLI
jgi:hypothetical protein